VISILYGFADASGTGFGSTVLGADGIKYRVGTWGKDEENESSNYRELENCVSTLEAEGESGSLSGALVFLCTDNTTAEAGLYKGSSASPKLFELIVRLRKVEMKFSCSLMVTHVSGERMKAQGTDGVSRGQMKEGVSAGASMLSFIPFHLSAIDRSDELIAWIRSWAGPELEVLAPEEWFGRGHDHEGGQKDEAGFWRVKTRPGIFLWVPPPAAADVAIEELRKARIKRQESAHIMVIPRLLSPEWLKQLWKASDVVFEVPAGSTFWGKSCFEPLIVGLTFPFLRCSPWQLRGTPKMLSVARHMRRLSKADNVDQGPVLRQLLLEQKRLQSMPADVVRRMLFFTQ
jgi:hypothetical protein